MVFLSHSRKITEDLCGPVFLVSDNVLLGQDFPTFKGIVMSSCLRVKKQYLTCTLPVPVTQRHNVTSHES